MKTKQNKFYGEDHSSLKGGSFCCALVMENEGSSGGAVILVFVFQRPFLISDSTTCAPTTTCTHFISPPLRSHSESWHGAYLPTHVTIPCQSNKMWLPLPITER